jgi:pilus assembly protein CpaB
MKNRLLSVLAFALAVSAGAAFVLYELISSKVTAGSANAAPPPKTTNVYVAARDLELGALIQERDLRIQEYLTPPAGAVTKKEELIGRGVINPIHRDAAFFDTELAPIGAGAGFAATIPKGMRAFAVHVNEVVGVAGFAVAGMHVDVLVSGTPPGAAATDGDGTITRTLLQNVNVISAGQNYQKDAEGKPFLVQVVNLLVTPQQAEILNLATDQKIQLVLRNPADHDIVETTGAVQAALFEGGAPRPRRREARPSPLPFAASPMPPNQPPPPRPVVVEVFAGSKRNDATFPPVGSSPGARPSSGVNPGFGLNPGFGVNPGPVSNPGSGINQ